MKKGFPIVIILFILLHSCGVLYHRKITCKPHIFKAEKFWFQGKKKDTYTLVNEITGAEKVFVLNDRWLSHREDYRTDTGCDCHDKSSQLLIANMDSIWTLADYRYIENKKPEFRDAFTFKFGDVKWIFNNETATITKGTQLFEGNEISIKTYTEIFDEKIYELIIGKGVGILSVRLNDETWKRKQPKKRPIVIKEDYRFMKNYCN